MTSLLPDSLNVSAMGKQFDSRQSTTPSFSFGTSNRDRELQKVYISEKHEARKAIMASAGPIYGLPSSMGDGPYYGFGTSQRPQNKAPYPDSSVDLIRAEVDSQTVKFHATKGVHFGTENRDNPKNAELLRTNPQIGLGVGVPGAGHYTPEDKNSATKNPQYPFGLKTKPQGATSSQTPRHVGPGSYSTPRNLGGPPSAVKPGAPAWSLPKGERMRSVPPSDEMLDRSPRVSALGKQIVSSKRNAPHHGFGTATRDHKARTQLIQLAEDKGPSAHLPPMRLTVPDF